MPCLLLILVGLVHGQAGINGIAVTTDFENGGGEVRIISQDPHVIRLRPHDEAGGGWSQVWWHFRVDGIAPGTEVTIELDRGDPECAGISPQACFSYDHTSWGLTPPGKEAVIAGRKFFVYRHTVHSDQIWFAYDLPYTQSHATSLTREAAQDAYAEIFELCKTQDGRSVPAIRLLSGRKSAQQPYGIFLQARTHAFESGSSWVLDGLTRWLLSADPQARALRSCAVITVIPIVDVDGVSEGRTGKNHLPFDHNRGWEEDPAHWPETTASRNLLQRLAEDGRLDMFIDFHGPGGRSHPYFIVPVSEALIHAGQRRNREAFFEALEARPLDDQARKRQSMTRIHYSARPWDRGIRTSSEWVQVNGNPHSIALTLEVNMNTPLSTKAGYTAEAIALGRAISAYFAGGRHRRQP